jgi:lysine 2,3-aminomutase
MRGMSHHRTSLYRGLELIRQLTSSGVVSGRATPRYAVLSDIGKIVIYDGVILARRPEDHRMLLRSGYRMQERLQWNPSWTIPAGSFVDEEGFLCTWYLDADDDVADKEA